MNLEEFLALAAKNKSFHAGLPATPAQIDRLEAELNTVFPRPYRGLLSRVGTIHWFGHAIFGFSDDPEDDTLTRTRSIRALIAEFFEADDSPMPEQGNVISEIFGGGFCFLHAEHSARSGQVSAYAPDERLAEVQYWASIEDYFDYLVHGVSNWRNLT